MTPQEMMARITSKPNVCGGRPCIRDTRIEIAVILDSLAEGMTEPEIIDHYPQLTKKVNTRRYHRGLLPENGSPMARN